jgi:hypothetical protein
LLAIALMMAVAWVAPRDARAQTSSILPSTKVFVAGPLSLYPQIALTDAGTDSNVHLAATNPTSDLSYTVTPRLYSVLPVGNTRFTGTATGNLIYYRTQEDQRSLTLLLDGRWEITSPGFRPWVETDFASRGERVGFEIDARARHKQSTVRTGADIDVTAITALTAWVGHSVTAYDEGTEYEMFLLADQLNHTRDTAAAGASLRVTPLTTLVIAAEVERDRFELAPLRDANGFRVASALALAAGAVVTGNVKAGLRSFTPQYPNVPSYRGFVGFARLHYALPDVVRIDLAADRDLAYSYDPVQPYFMESGGRLTIAQRIFGPVELIGLGEWRETRNQRIGGRSFDGRREVTTSLGGGLGLRVNRETRFAMTYERTERVSTTAGREYQRTRMFASFYYGL